MTVTPPDIRELANQPATSAQLSSPRELHSDPERLWSARPILSTIYQLAHRQLFSPWPLLGAILVRSLTSIPYTVRYRSSWRPQGSPLNLMVAMTGSSGAGKSLLDELAGTVVEFVGADIPAQETPRSGEGVPASIGKMRTEADETGTARMVVEYRHPSHAHRFWWDEVGKLAAQSRRTGSTMLEYLKELVSGSALGGQTAAGDGLIIPGGTYRATVTLSVQPRRAEALLGSAETEGGLAGRIVWFDLHYPEFAAADLPPRGEPIEPVRCYVDHWHTSSGYVDALPEMETAHETDRRLAHMRQRDDLQSHQTLMRAHIAIALMNLDGRDQLNTDDWSIAGMVMQHSQDTLQSVQEELASPDPNAGDELNRREDAVIRKMHERRDQGIPYRDAYSKLGRSARDTARELLQDGRLQPW